VGLFLACWFLAALAALGLLDLAGVLPLSLYALYSTAAALGWLAGNVYVWRARGVEGRLRSRMRWIYLLGPPGIVYLLRAMAPRVDQLTAPLVPLYSLGVYVALFLVPILMRCPPPAPPTFRR